MKKRTIILAGIILLLSLNFQNALFGQSRRSLRNDFGIELLGKAAIYCFSYQYMLSHPLGVEVGLSALGGGSAADNATIIFIPVGAKYYFVPKHGSPFLTGGVVIVSASVNSGPFGDSGSDTYFYTGLGFEYRSPGGFMFRGTAYGLIAGGGFFIWPGLYVGYAF